MLELKSFEFSNHHFTKYNSINFQILPQKVIYSKMKTFTLFMIILIVFIIIYIIIGFSYNYYIDRGDITIILYNVIFRKEASKLLRTPNVSFGSYQNLNELIDMLENLKIKNLRKIIFFGNQEEFSFIRSKYGDFFTIKRQNPSEEPVKNLFL
jgi:c-di-AMP phosphodiesterase-like protein